MILGKYIRNLHLVNFAGDNDNLIISGDDFLSLSFSLWQKNE